MIQKTSLGALLLCCCLLFSSCATSAQSAPLPEPSATSIPGRKSVKWPENKLERNENGIPLLDVYVVDEKTVHSMDIETYVQGVLAGEMKNDWPIEALKAQAILARTFVLKFIDEKESKYPGAHISTDIEEAQAYSTNAINDTIRRAVEATRGMVLAFDGELPYAWFHAHSGGMTDLARTGLGWDDTEPGYTRCADGMEPQNATDMQALRDAQSWTASFPYEEFESALNKLGVETALTENSSLAISKRGESGRADTISVEGQEVNAAELRIALGSTKMRSTLLSSLKAEKGTVTMAGKGYGHGVGMSQWGAYGMAQSGKSAMEIVKHFFQNVTVEKLW